MSDGTNLLEETMYALQMHDKTVDDIRWVGGDDFTIPLDHFLKIANASYNRGYGAPEVATDLKVVGDDWWLERHEYDGSEWWEYKTLPKMPIESQEVESVMDGMWDTLSEIQERSRR